MMRFAGPKIDMDPRNLPYLPVLRYAGSVAQEQPEVVERNWTLREILTLKGYNLLADDFMALPVEQLTADTAHL